jgi:hypothetical protein
MGNGKAGATAAHVAADGRWATTDTEATGAHSSNRNSASGDLEGTLGIILHDVGTEGVRAALMKETGGGKGGQPDAASRPVASGSPKDDEAAASADALSRQDSTRMHLGSGFASAWRWFVAEITPKPYSVSQPASALHHTAQPWDGPSVAKRAAASKFK